MIKNIFLDVDGVLADFTGHALRLFDRADLIKDQEPGVYDIGSLLGIPQSEFWATIDTILFWHSIPVYKGAHSFARRLFKTCKNHGIRLHYCTVGTTSKYFPEARTKWLRTFNHDAGIDVPIILMAKWDDKALLSKPGCLFIDDNDKIIHSVKAAGGVGLRVPQMWNKDYAAAKDPDKYDLLFKRIEWEIYYAKNDGPSCEGGLKCSGHCTHGAGAPPSFYLKSYDGPNKALPVYCGKENC